ncbi:WD40-repeat-containing domain protein, partial [Gamsiella multidivaricata]|uniref:WD40-repeat-containing domain protein n=1 Tax=Gamsiella multidivaricata TaxID=101098 RepID=UPI00221ED213
SPDGRFCAVGLYDGTISVYDTSTWAKVHTLRGHTDPVLSVVYSPIGQQIASGSWDSTVRLWDAQTGASGPILSGHTDIVTSVVYSPNGQQIASGSRDKTVRVWGAQTGAPGPILSGHTEGVTSVVYSPSGQQIASGSSDNTVRLWDVNSGQCLAVVKDFHGSITSITWNPAPNGTYFATGCWDKSVRMWQVIEEEDRYQVRLHWSSMHDRLTLSDTSIQNVQGLSRINMRLLEQRGAVGKPIAPLNFREACKMLISMASVAHKLKVPSKNQSMTDTVTTTDSLTVQSTKPVDSADVFLLAGDVKMEQIGD